MRIFKPFIELALLLAALGGVNAHARLVYGVSGFLLPDLSSEESTEPPRKLRAPRVVDKSVGRTRSADADHSSRPERESEELDTSTRESRRRSPSQIQADGAQNFNYMPKAEGLGFAFGRESIFRNVSGKMLSFKYRKGGLNGRDFMNALQNYTSEKSCIPKLVIAGHGWGADQKHRSAIASGSIARDNNQGLSLDGRGVTIRGDLADAVEDGRIKFCGGCEIFIHACSISGDYSRALVQATHCKVTSADNKVSPVDTRDGRYDNIWNTSGGGKFRTYYPLNNGTVAQKTIGQEFNFYP